MKFTNPFAKKKESDEYILGLFVKHEGITAVLYRMTNGLIETVVHKDHLFSNGWDNIVEDVDETLLQIEQEHKKPFEKVILFLHSYLVDQEEKQIKLPFKNYLRKLFKELELKPLGFIECYEAVVSHLQKKDNTFLNAILIELDGDNLGVFLYKGGRKIAEHIGTKTNHITQELHDIFETMKSDTMLPSRLVVFASKENKEEIGDLLSHHWDTKYFIQVPRAELFQEADLLSSFSETFQDQMKSMSENSLDEIEVPPEKPQGEYLAQEPKTRLIPDDERYDEDELKDVPQKQAGLQNVMGFMIGDDISTTENNAPVEKVNQTTEFSTPEGGHARALSDKVAQVKVSVMRMMARARTYPIFKKLKGGSKIPYIAGAAVLVLLVGLFSIEYFFHKVTLTVYFPSQEISKSIDLSEPLDNNEIDLKVGTVSATITNKKPTTGTHQVGEKAKGSVTLYNFDDADHVFPKGTKLGASGHSFVLDGDEKVASASEVLIGGDYVKQPGKAAGTIIANDIGPDSNLDKGNKFQIESLSTSLFFAINDSALSGGTKKDIKTVAKVDADTLKKQALDTGGKQGQEDLKKVTQSKDEQVLGALTEITPKKLSFSNDIGEEATDLKLDADIGVTYFTYSSKLLKKLVKTELDPSVKEGFALPSEKVNYTVKEAQNNDGVIDLTLDAKGKAVKKFSTEELLSKIRGHAQSQVESILKSQFQATGMGVEVQSAPLFFLRNRMPLARKNITLKIDSL